MQEAETIYLENFGTWDPADSDATWQAEPREAILADIEFDANGDITLSFVERRSHNRVTMDAGELLRVCLQNDGTYKDEHSGGCLQHHEENTRDTSVTYDEFYRGDYWDYGSNDGTYGLGQEGHPESALGALAAIDGLNRVLATIYDPNASDQPGGFVALANRNNAADSVDGPTNEYGDSISRKLLIDSDEPEHGIYGGKSGGLGDIEILEDPAPIEIGNYVWLDTNKNGIQDPNEEVLSSIVVSLHSGDSCSNNKIGEATTDNDGHYYFGGKNSSNLTNDTLKYNTQYTLCIDLSQSKLSGASATVANVNGDNNDTIDSDGVEDGNGYIATTLTTDDAGQNNHTYDFGIFKPICLGDYVWEDTNANGIQESTEPPIADVGVELYMKNSNGEWVQATHADGTAVASTETNSSGGYEFCDLEPSVDYKIVFEIPSDMNITLQNQGDDTLDSDIDQNASVVVEKPTEDDMTIDAGFYKPACLGDYVWYDANKDGIQDSSESAVADVVVHLYKDGTDTGESNKTDSSGNYKFCGLIPGEYSVKFDKPSNYQGFTQKDQGGDETKDSDADTDGNTESVTLKSGDDYLDLDAGLIKPPASIDIEKYTQDREGNFQQADDINDSDVPVLLEGQNVTWKYVITNNGGQNLTDVTMDDDKVGAPDRCEDENGDSVTLPTTLDINKSITCYKEGIVQDASINNAEYENNATTNAKDSDSNDVTDSDLSHYKVEAPACIGDLVWLDTNGNGVQDSTENGIAGAKVELYLTVTAIV